MLAVVLYDTPGLFQEDVLEEVEFVGGEASAEEAGLEEAGLIEGSNVLWIVVVKGGAGLTEEPDGADDTSTKAAATMDERPPALEIVPLSAATSRTASVADGEVDCVASSNSTAATAAAMGKTSQDGLPLGAEKVALEAGNGAECISVSFHWA